VTTIAFCATLGSGGPGGLLPRSRLMAYSNSFSGGLEGDSGAAGHTGSAGAARDARELRVVFTPTYWYPTADSAGLPAFGDTVVDVHYVLLGNGERASDTTP